MPAEERELLWLRRVRDLSHLLATEQDVRKLLPRILDAAIEITGAERGLLVLVQPGRQAGRLGLRVEVARGFDQVELQGSEGTLSRTVIKRVLSRGDRGLVTTSDEDCDVLGVTSIRDQTVKSILVVPLRLRGETRGVLYLDHHRDQLAFDDQDLPILQSFADQAALALETAESRGAPESPRSPRRPLGKGPAMARLEDEVERAARSWAPVLILGEPGAGKERVAREIHAHGARAAEPFVVLSAQQAGAAFEQLLAGAAGGALPPAFLEAGQGSIYLDEVADLDPRAQLALLGTLRDEHLQSGAAPLACRLLAASHADLRARCQAGSFREDLYYHLDVMRVVVPPLRERPEDVVPLLEGLAAKQGTVLRLSVHAQELLRSYAWPGNLRELENEVQRLVASGQRRISSRQLSVEIQEGRGVARVAAAAASGKTLDEVERAMVEAAIRECNGNKSRAARQLGIPRTTLYHLLQKYGLA